MLGTAQAPLERLRLRRADVAAIVQHLRSVYPEEGCGLVAVQGDAEIATRLYPVRNVAEEPRRHYLGEPLAVLEALLEIERQGWRLGAIYHSHPHGPDRPSAEDIRQAYYPTALTLLVSLARPDQPSLRLFTIRDGQVDERQLLVDDDEVDER